MAFDEAVTVYGDPLSVLLPDPGTTVSRRYEHHRFGPLSWTSFPIPRRSTRRCEPSRRFSGGASGLKDGSEAPNKGNNILHSPKVVMLMWVFGYESRRRHARTPRSIPDPPTDGVETYAECVFRRQW